MLSMEHFVERGYADRMLVQLKDALSPIASHFADPAVTEIMINGPDNVYIESSKTGMGKLSVKLSRTQIATAITILASMVERQVSETRTATAEKSCMLSSRFPGFRVEAFLPPVARRGPGMVIRRHASRVFTLDDYVAAGTMTRAQADLVGRIVEARETLIVAGGTGSGKTTLLNALISRIPPHERLVIIEIISELLIVNPDNHVVWEVDSERGVTPAKALHSALRARPDRIMLGELRGGEAYSWLAAANTGHPGSMATLHADSAADAADRLETMAMEAGSGVDFQAMQRRISKTVKWSLFIERTSQGRRLSQIARIDGFDLATRSYITTDFTEGDPHEQAFTRS
jgi:pilus assembly protein CpaF